MPTASPICIGADMRTAYACIGVRPNRSESAPIIGLVSKARSPSMVMHAVHSRAAFCFPNSSSNTLQTKRWSQQIADTDPLRQLSGTYILTILSKFLISQPDFSNAHSDRISNHLEAEFLLSLLKAGLDFILHRSFSKTLMR